MKISLLFNDDKEDDRLLLKKHMKAEAMYNALWEITHNLKKNLTRRFEVADNTNNDVFDGLEAYAEEISEILARWDIDTDSIGED